MRSHVLIDPPSTFAPVEDWQTHLASMRKMSERHPGESVYREFAAAAEARIAREDEIAAMFA